MSPLLCAENVRFAYTDRPVLREVSLSMCAGEVVALLGPNGSGKSTLIKALLGQARASGVVRWNDRDLSQWTQKELARTVAYLPQSPTYEPEHRVLDALRLGRAPYWQAFGIESARDAEVVQRVASLLELDDVLSRRMSDLSGGQRQRVFLGRALVQEPRAMLLDEPNTFLDLKHQIELGRLLRRLAAEQKLGVLMASHDLNLAGLLADRIVLLHEGAIVSDGPPDHVLKPEILADVYGVQMQRIERDNGQAIVIPVL